MNTFKWNNKYMDSKVLDLNNSFLTINDNQRFKYHVKISILRLILLLSTFPFVLILGLFNNSIFPTFITSNDKLVHLLIFFMETYLYLKIFLKFNIILFNKIKLNIFHVFFITCILCGCIFTEYLQHWINPNRSFDLMDMLFNSIGSSFGYFLYRYIHDF